MFDWVFELLWNLIRSILKIIYYLEQSFMWLAGGKSIPAVDSNDTPTNGGTLLEGIFTNTSVTGIFTRFMLIGIMLTLLFLIFAIVRSEYVSKDSTATKKKAISKSIISIITVALMPIIFILGIQLVSSLFYEVSGILVEEIFSGSTGNPFYGQIPEQNSISQSLFLICLPEIRSGQTLPPDLVFTMSFAELNLRYNMQQFDFLLGFLVGLILVIIVGLTAINLVERLINVILLFLVSPFVLSSVPLDDGNRFNIWRDMVIAKLLSAGGIILSMYLYYLVVPYVQRVFPSGVSPAFDITRLVVIIGGALVSCKGGLTIAQLIGHNTGVAEGMHQGQTGRIMLSGLSTGASIVGGGLKTVMFGTAGAAASAAGKTLSNMTGGSGGGVNISGGSGSGGASGFSRIQQAMSRGVFGNVKAGYEKMMNSSAGVSSTAERLQMNADIKNTVMSNSPDYISSQEKMAERKNAYMQSKIDDLSTKYKVGPSAKKDIEGQLKKRMTDHNDTKNDKDKN